MKLPLEIIEQITLSLSLPHLLSCKLVCKDWKEALSSEQFCRKYVFHNYDFTDGEPTGFLKEWLDPEEWYCYWTDDDDGPARWVFGKSPKQWKCGIVHPTDLNPETNYSNIKFSDFLVAMARLNKLMKGAEEFDIVCEAWGNESGGSLLQPFLMPWSEDNLPMANDIFDLFQFNPEMREGCHSIEVSEQTEPEVELDEDTTTISWQTLCCYEAGPGTQEFFQFLKRLFFPAVLMCIGCDALNSVPVFFLTKLAPGWVGGYMSGVTCT